jgi:hypothetical protein
MAIRPPCTRPYAISRASPSAALSTHSLRKSFLEAWPEGFFGVHGRA